MNGLVARTGMPATNGVFRDDKATTAVAMDCGGFGSSDHRQSMVFGMPGQWRFAVRGKILERGAGEAIVPIGNVSGNRIDDPDHVLDLHIDRILTIPTVVGVTRSDLGGNPGLNAAGPCWARAQ